ncbi:MAG TPA: DUF2786 domain-containing protein [Thermodesulfobacteriota bacterium]|nr:DUF2786 domain-containing protein [Thermodesulfobacteriota bacterium]
MKSKVVAQQELENRILHGLACEWERAIWILDSAHRKKMRRPLFSLRDLNGRWGTWSGERREISLSRRLVLNYSWASVREVLFHEMAHQMAEEVLGGQGETAHGPFFRRACDLLRANPRASENYRPLDDRISQEPLDGEDRILARVKKLLALAESSNRHEAEAAMAKAHELISKYNLDLLRTEKQKEFISLLVGRPALRHFLEDYALAGLLQDFYFVQGVWVPGYVPEKGKMGRVLEISGTIPNVRIADYVHNYVQRFIALEWKEYNSGRALNRYRLTDFAQGIIEGFRSKLTSKEQDGGKERTSYALIKKEDPLLKEYLAYRYPHMAMIKTGRGNQDPGVRRDGKRIGKELVISKGVMEGAGNRGRLLPS